MPLKLTAFENKKFSVGLSFAGEQRSYVQDVVLSLKEKDVSVFYDRFHEVDLWGCDLVDTLHDLYSERFDLVIVFVSEDYVKKDFTNLERHAALSTAIRKAEKYILPVKFDSAFIIRISPLRYRECKLCSVAVLRVSGTAELTRLSDVQHAYIRIIPVFGK